MKLFAMLAVVLLLGCTSPPDPIIGVFCYDGNSSGIDSNGNGFAELHGRILFFPQSKWNANGICFDENFSMPCGINTVQACDLNTAGWVV